MTRQYYVNGECMVLVKGPAGSLIAATTQLGLSVDRIEITVNERDEDIGVDAYGKGNPPDQQLFGGEASVVMDLVHFDPVILEECIRLTFTAPTEGTLGRAGTLRGGNLPLYAAGNFYMSLGLTAPIGGIPWTFLSSFLERNPATWPVGTGRSVVRLNWRAIAYSVDPWNGGTGSLGIPVYNHVLLT